MSKLKVLVAIEDFKDHGDAVDLLTKAGWGVRSVKRDILIKDEILAFNPDLLVVSGRGRQIDGVKLAKTLYRRGGRPRIALYMRSEEVSRETLRGVPVDAVLETPLDAERFLRALCRICQVDENAVLDKYRRAETESRGQLSEDNGITHLHGDRQHRPLQHLRGGGAKPRRNWLTDSYRQELYADLVKSIDENSLNEWDLAEVKKTEKTLREAHSPELEKLDDERKEFVRALFKRD